MCLFVSWCFSFVPYENAAEIDLCASILDVGPHEKACHRSEIEICASFPDVGPHEISVLVELTDQQNNLGTLPFFFLFLFL